MSVFKSQRLRTEEAEERLKNPHKGGQAMVSGECWLLKGPSNMVLSWCCTALYFFKNTQRDLHIHVNAQLLHTRIYIDMYIKIKETTYL